MIKIHETAYIAPSAVIIGTVTIGKYCSVFPNAVLRGDENYISIDDGSNIQDCCVLHVDTKHSLEIGKNVTIGHGAVIHGANIDDTCLIGIHATVLNGATIRKGSIIGAGAVVTENMDVPENSLVLGVPGKIIKQDEKYTLLNEENAQIYQRLARNHKQGMYDRYQK
ncbi:MAG: gamma carbonic anhydrase family protein [Candidatus Thermoplasmatota archaeon]